MKINVKTTLFLISLILSMTNVGHALDLDASVDDEIRKNYNPDKLINDVGLKTSALEKNMQADIIEQDPNLPALPSISNKGNSTKPSDVTGTNIVPSVTYPKLLNGNVRVPSGASFNVVNSSAISDWQAKGTKLTFKTQRPIYGKRYTIPAGTIFYGEIIDRHQPQISCNGGLVVIRVYSMIYKGQTVPLTGYITRANDKKIFFNNIKGERTFLKTMWKKGNWGRTMFSKMLTVSVGLSATGSTVVLTPFPFAYGTLCLGANTIISPITAFFSKGGHVSIPAGSAFRIKLIEDAMIN